MNNKDVQNLKLAPAMVESLRKQLPAVAELVVAAVVSEVPEYADPFRGRMGAIIEQAVHVALAGFLDLASSADGIAPGQRVQQVFEASYALGRGEARAGRQMDALAAAYRVGARRAWRELSRLGVARGLDAESIAHFAEMVFDYIDQLSDASVAGHADELASEGQIRLRRRERLADKLLAGDPAGELSAAAARAEWSPPNALAAVILPEARARALRAIFDPRSLFPGEIPQELEEQQLGVVLVPDAQGPGRRALRQMLAGEDAVLGPARAWHEVVDSYQRAKRVLDLEAAPRGEVIDTDLFLAPLIASADPVALAELRRRVGEPLTDLTTKSREKMTETLIASLLYQGRRDDIAAALFVHPQTVRYRMGQLRELYGERLNDPHFVLEAVVALGGSRSWHVQG